MTADIINLRRARKTQTRRTREQQAAENRALYGRSKAERTREVAERRKAESDLDGVRRDATGTAMPECSGDEHR